MTYNSTQEAFEKDTGLPGSTLPQGQGYILRPNQMIDIPQSGGIKKTFYPSITGGQLDLFGIEVPAGQDEKSKQEDEISQRMEAYKAMSIFELQKDLLNAGSVADEKGKMAPGDPVLVEMAYQEHILRTSKINAWNQRLQDNFNVIKKEEKLDQNEKQILRNKILAESDDPIHIPTTSPRESVFPPAYVQKNLGEMTAKLNTGGYLDRDEAINDLISRFGPDAESKLPGVVQFIDSKFTQSVSNVGKVGEIKNQSEYDSLPVGSSYIQNGKSYTKGKR